MVGVGSDEMPPAEPAHWAWRHPIRYGLSAGAATVLAGLRTFPGELWPVPAGVVLGAFCWWMVTSSQGRRWAAAVATNEQAIARGEAPPPGRRALVTGACIGAIPGALTVVVDRRAGVGQAVLLLLLGAAVGLATAGLWVAIVRARRRRQRISR